MPLLGEWQLDPNYLQSLPKIPGGTELTSLKNHRTQQLKELQEQRFRDKRGQNNKPRRKCLHFAYIIYMCVYMRGTHVAAYVERSEESLWKSILSSYRQDPRVPGLAASQVPLPAQVPAWTPESRETPAWNKSQSTTTCETQSVER